MKSCMKYHGGKYYLRKKICGMMVPHDIYIEPFFGAGHVFFEKQDKFDNPYCKNIINDINFYIMNMWEIIRDYPQEFMSALKIIQYNPFSFQSVYGMGRFEQAIETFVKYRMSIGGRGKNFAKPSNGRQRRGMPDNISAWESAIDLIQLNSAHLFGAVNRVEIKSGLDALDVIQPYLKEPNCLIYLDPPYLPKTRKSPNIYKWEMTADQHERLVKSIEASTAKIILSGYDNDLYNTVLASWNKEVIPMKNHAASGKKKRTMSEVLWYNYG